MVIKNLDIENFYGIEKLNIQPDKLNVLLAPNGTGKTSVMKAIKYVLSGDSTGDFVRKGSSGALVSADINGYSISRNGALKINGKNTTQKSLTDILERSVGTKLNVMKLIMASESLGEMTSADLSKFFLENNLIPISVDFNKIKTLCTLSTEAEDELSQILPSAPDLITLDDIENAYNYYFIARKNIKNEINAKMARAEYNGPKPIRTGDEIDSEYLSVIASENNIKQSTELINNYKKAVLCKEKTEKEIALIKQEIAANTSIRPNINKLNKIKTDLAEANRDIIDKNKLITLLNDSIKSTETTITNLNSNKCPISCNLICNTDKSVIKDELTELLTRTKEQLVIEQDTLDKITKIAEKAQIDERNYLDNEKLYNKKLVLIDKCELLEKNIQILPPEPVVITITDYSARKSALANEKKNLIAYENALKEASQAEFLRQKLRVYEELIKKLSPKTGIRSAIIDFALSPLIDECNQTAKDLKLDFEIKILCSDGLRLFCKPHANTEFIEYKNISSGEKLLVEFLFMDMINSLSGFKMLLIDNLDKLDCSSYDNLLNLLSKPEIQQRYDHIFISAVDHEDFINVTNKYSNINRVFS